MDDNPFENGPSSPSATRYRSHFSAHSSNTGLRLIMNEKIKTKRNPDEKF